MGTLKGPVVRGWAVGTDPRVGLIPEAFPPLLPCSPPPTRPVVSPMGHHKYGHRAQLPRFSLSYGMGRSHLSKGQRTPRTLTAMCFVAQLLCPTCLSSGHLSSSGCASASGGASLAGAPSH